MHRRWRGLLRLADVDRTAVATVAGRRQVLLHPRARAAIDVDFALDRFQLHTMLLLAVVDITLLGVPLEFDNIFELHLARLAVVEYDHHLPVLMLLLQRLLLMDEQMLFQVRILRVGLRAQGAGVWPDAEMYHFVFLQIGTLRESLITAFAFEWFFSGMEHLMLHHIGLLGKCFVTGWTFVRFDSAVEHLMFDHVCLLGKGFIANRTFVRFYSGVKHLVFDHVGLLGECLATGATFVRF